ncbi:MAG: HAD-IA family hydrolase [Sphingobacteriales bacterium JAD_PAG50586_3]|nr:MAG: HAD-IA family hydrolase [Sphingobacteriales bacterium JAD_PAG50586_3]
MVPPIPVGGVTISELAERVVHRLNQLLTERAVPMPGVVKTLEFFKQRNIPMVVASSSNLSIIENAVNGLGIAHYFQSLHSAQFEEYGKPHPAVFLKAAASLSIAPVNCLVFEDSLFGLLAAKSAKMKAISVPSHLDINNPKFSIADAILPSLEEWSEEVFNLVDKG